jgi:hypothetical protein
MNKLQKMGRDSSRKDFLCLKWLIRDDECGDIIMVSSRVIMERLTKMRWFSVVDNKDNGEREC